MILHACFISQDIIISNVSVFYSLEDKLTQSATLHYVPVKIFFFVFCSARRLTETQNHSKSPRIGTIIRKQDRDRLRTCNMFFTANCYLGHLSQIITK